VAVESVESAAGSETRHRSSQIMEDIRLSKGLDRCLVLL
jgi:hypothetical protein